MSGGEFFVQEPSVRAFIAEVQSVLERESDIRKCLASLRAPYRQLLQNQSWLPEEFRQPSISLHLLANDTGCVIRQKITQPLAGSTHFDRAGVTSLVLNQ